MHDSVVDAGFRLKTQNNFASFSGSINSADRYVLCSRFPVVMSRYNQASTSADSSENALNASNVNQASFGKLYGYYVNGSVFAQPLYLLGENWLIWSLHTCSGGMNIGRSLTWWERVATSELSQCLIGSRPRSIDGSALPIFQAGGCFAVCAVLASVGVMA
jgi:hypothetical protein